MDVLVNFFKPMLPISIVSYAAFIVYCRFLPVNFRRNRAYMLLPVILGVTFIWRLMLNSEIGRYYILLNIPCVLLAGIGIVYLAELCRKRLPCFKKYCIPICVLGLGAICIAKTLSPPDPKAYLEDMPRVINEHVSANKYLNPVYVDFNSNQPRINFYSNGSFETIANYDFRKQTAKALESFKKLFPKLRLEHDIIYLAAREENTGDMLSQAGKVLNHDLDYSLLKQYPQRRGKPVNLYGIKIPTDTFGSLTVSELAGKGLLANGDFEVSENGYKLAEHSIKALRAKGIKCFGINYQWKFPGWIPNPGHGWKAEQPDNYAGAEKIDDENFLRLSGENLAIRNIAGIDGDKEVTGLVVLKGRQGSKFSVFLNLVDKKSGKYIVTKHYKSFFLLDNKKRYFRFSIEAHKGCWYNLTFHLAKGDVLLDKISLYDKVNSLL